MVQHRKFMDLVLDEQGLHTPDGVLALDRITKVDIILNFPGSNRERGSKSPGAGILAWGAARWRYRRSFWSHRRGNPRGG